jgi:uncharacterized protein YaiE (UPF0345 family)
MFTYALIAAALWCAPVEPETLTCVADSCVVDYECAKQWDRWACHCCASTPGKQQANVQVCNAGKPPAECK